MRILWKVLSAILALVLCFGALGGLVAWVTIQSVERMMTEEALYRIMDEADTDAILTSLLSSSGENVLTQMANSEAVKELVVNYFVGYCHYLITSEGEFTLSDEQKQALVDAIVEAAAGQSGASSESLEKVLRMQTEVTLEGVLTQYIPSYRELDIGLSQSDIEVIRMLFSTTTKTLLLGLVAACMLLIMLVRFSWHEWLAWGGFTGLVAGAALVSVNMVLNIAAESSLSGNAMADQLVMAVIQELGSGFTRYGLWVLAISAVMVVLFFVVRAMLHRRAATQGMHVAG